jgi:hypothetical protein
MIPPTAGGANLEISGRFSLEISGGLARQHETRR